MTKNQLFNAVSSQSWFMTPRIVIQTVGLAEGALLCYMIDIAKYHNRTTFYMRSEEEVAKNLGLPSRKVLSGIMQRLEERGYISRERKGVPARFYYTINVEKIGEIFNNDLSLEGQLDVQNEIQEESVVPAGNKPLSLEGQQEVTTRDNYLNKQTKQTKKHIERAPSIQDKDLVENREPSIPVNQPEDSTLDKHNQLFNQLVALYPAHLVKPNKLKWVKNAFDQLTTEEAEAAVKHLSVYLKLWGDYIHNLENYITGKHFTREALAARKNSTIRSVALDTKTNIGNFA